MNRPPDALREVLETILWPNSSPDSTGRGRRVWRYSECFDEFWARSLPVTAGPSESFPIVILWDGPIGSPDVPSILSPVAWALSLGDKAPRTLVFDLNPAVHSADAICHTARLTQDLLRERLWILSADEIADHFDKLVAWVGAETTAATDSVFELLRAQLRSELLGSRGEVDRHHVSNLVGPLLLGQAVQTVEQTALRVLLERLEALPAIDGGEEVPQPSSVVEVRLSRADIAGVRLPLRAVLVDDHVGKGWGEVLCRALGVDYKPKASQGRGAHQLAVKGAISVWGAASPHFLLERLRQLVESPQGLSAETLREQRFGFNLAGSESDGSEILLLDLRLFPPENWTREVQYYGDLLEIASHFQKLDPESLPWRGIRADELQQLDYWLKNDPGRETEGHHLALTLLPRLLALVDPALPIIIFSSTGRREIVAPLRDYGNVITTFTKPNLTAALPADAILNARSQLSEALRQAAGLLRARARCLDFLEAENPYDAPFPADDQTKYYVELYIDESQPARLRSAVGGWFWRVGGCFAVFSGATHDAARAKADRFDDTLVEEGVRFFEWPGVGPASETVATKSDNQEGATRYLAGLDKATKVGCAPECFGMVALTDKAPPWDRDGRNELIDPRSYDNLFLLTMSGLVELFLYEALVASVGPRADVSVALHADFRRKPLTAQESLGRLEYQFGVQPALPKWDGTPCMLSFGNNDLATMVRDISRFRTSRHHVERAIVGYLPTGRNRVSQFVCRHCRERVDVTPEPVVGKVYPARVDAVADYGYFVAVGRDFSGLLHNSQNPPSLVVGATINVRVTGWHDQSKNRLSLEWTEDAASLGILHCTGCGQHDPVRPDVRALHYVADQVLTDLLERSPWYGDTFGTLTAGEFDEDFSADGEKLLQASRALEHDIAQAVVLFPTTDGGQSPSGKPRIRDFLRWRIGQNVKHLDGSSILRIARELKAGT